jgi:RHS repeat-associated protein
MFWDEDNRLMVLSDNGKTSRYTYNHAGERVVKSHGSMEGVYINGAPQGITFHETDEYTLYPASILSVTKNRFTKHYFIGSKRVASRIGSGSFNNMYGVNGSHVTAGQQDYAERLNQIESQKEDYYKKLGIAPGIPTMKGSYADPENTGVGYNTIIKELGDHSVPAEWAQYVKKNTEADTAPGAPIAWDDPSDPDEAQPGYGFVADGSADSEETYFFHSDHLGSTSYITDKDGNITQYDAYLPYGELLVDEHSSSEEMPYKFNGKEFDEETGLYYYGARYMNPVSSVWYGVDPLTEKYVEISAYVYCHGNPIRLIDPDGKNPVYSTSGEYIGCTSEGYTGQIYIYNISDAIKLTNNSSDLLDGNNLGNMNVKKLQSYKGVYSMDNSKLDGDALSNIWTDVVANYNGKEVFDKTFDISTIKDSKIYYDNSALETDMWGTFHDLGYINGSGNYMKGYYESTVENIQSSLIFHEWYSHLINNYCDNNNNHRVAYENVINSNLWKKTTDNYKCFVLRCLKAYTKKETRSEELEKKYKELYDRYVK